MRVNLRQDGQGEGEAETESEDQGKVRESDMWADLKDSDDGSSDEQSCGAVYYPDGEEGLV